jgi:dihydrolipoamide dehydrogenase
LDNAQPKQHDLVIIGGGPAGYVAAIRAAQLGLDAACVEREKLLGGTCLRVGCIPSKALLESTHLLAQARDSLAEHGVHVSEVRPELDVMMKRKDRIVQTLSGGVEALLKQNRVTRYRGAARLDGPGRVIVEETADKSSDPQPSTLNPQLLESPRILLACGSKPASLSGIELDGDRIGTSSEALAYAEIPERLVVIGAGYIGLELGSVWRRLGSEVVVLEALDRILPGMDAELATAAYKIFAKQGLQFILGARVEKATAQKGGAVVECQGRDPIRCDRVLVAVGRVADTEHLGLATVGIQPDRRGEIPVGDGFQTPAQGVFAVGDCIRGPKLAHKASHEAITCVERMVNGFGHVNYDAIPGVVYTHPEIASVGQTEEQLREAGREFRRGTFPFAASGRARTLGETDGLVKILADAQTDRILGVHILGPRAGDLIAEAAAAIEFGASAEDLARVCHAHPTLAESLGEAALDVAGLALHRAPRKK